MNSSFYRTPVISSSNSFFHFLDRWNRRGCREKWTFTPTSQMGSVRIHFDVGRKDRDLDRAMAAARNGPIEGSPIMGAVTTMAIILNMMGLAMLIVAAFSDRSTKNQKKRAAV